GSSERRRRRRVLAGAARHAEPAPPPPQRDRHPPRRRDDVRDDPPQDRGVLRQCRPHRGRRAPPLPGDVVGVIAAPPLVNRERVEAFMAEAGLHAVIGASQANVFYLSGYHCWLEPLMLGWMAQPGASSLPVQESFALLPS